MSPAESTLVQAHLGSAEDYTTARSLILEGADPLGDALCASTDLEARRDSGIFYTPAAIVKSMAAWVLESGPCRVVDAGCGSGRFAAEVILRDRDVEIIAVDTDPVATLACRAVLKTLGATNARVFNVDYTTLRLPAAKGLTAFIGNPPYVRHHRLNNAQKSHAKAVAAKLGIQLSGLAGLQVHFFLATYALAKQGDIGAFITSAEWLDVNYGQGLRRLLAGDMGLLELQLFNQEDWAFQDAMTTALITKFKVGSTTDSVRVMRPGVVSSVDLAGEVETTILREAKRWTPLVRPNRQSPSGAVTGLTKLGDIVRVSRGVATGANSFFVMSRTKAHSMGLDEFAVPVLHEARQIFRSNGRVLSSDTDQVLLDVPSSIDLSSDRNTQVREYLSLGKSSGVDKRYLSAHRKPWWRMGAKAPPIVGTYMARQPPAFALNPDGMRILNVMHGLYPKVLLSDRQLEGLVNYLNSNRLKFRGYGRTYQGGLEKFEPSEMEALLVPTPQELSQFASG